MLVDRESAVGFRNNRAPCRLALALACAAIWLCGCGAPSLPEHPNVLFITLDDLSWDSVGAYGSGVPDVSPNIDRLASQGLRFQQAHVTVAVCQPARAAWMTGRYPQNSGVLGFNPIDPGVPTLPETLRSHGYLTGILGKFKHVVPGRPQAFDIRHGGAEMRDGRSAALYARFSSEFLAEAQRSGKPFFLMVNSHDPHRPFDSRVPAGQRRGGYPAPSRIYAPEEVVVPGSLPDLPDVREDLARYYSSVRRADDIVGAVLQVLDDSGYAKSTLVVLQSDHGASFPFSKAGVWRSSTRVPYIVRWPGVVEPGAVDTEHLLGGVDFAPTILAAAGLPPLPGSEGRSFLPLLQGRSLDGFDRVYTQFDVTASGHAYPMRAVEDARYGYIWNGWADGETAFDSATQRSLTVPALLRAAEHDPAIAARVRHLEYRSREEFYDYQEDPDALSNRIHDPELASQVAALRAALLRHLTESRDPELAHFRRTTGL